MGSIIKKIHTLSSWYVIPNCSLASCKNLTDWSNTSFIINGLIYYTYSWLGEFTYRFFGGRFILGGKHSRILGIKKNYFILNTHIMIYILYIGWSIKTRK